MSPWFWNKQRVNAVMARRNRIRAYNAKQFTMNATVMTFVVPPLLILNLIGFVLMPIGWLVIAFRKPLALMAAGALGVAGIYWSEWFPNIDEIKSVDYHVYLWIKYLVPGVLFACGFNLTSDLYSGFDSKKD